MQAGSRLELIPAFEPWLKTHCSKQRKVWYNMQRRGTPQHTALTIAAAWLGSLFDGLHATPGGLT